MKTAYDPETERSYTFSKKQANLIELVANGLTNKEIAEELEITVVSVRNRISHIMQKIDVSNRVQIAKFYYLNMR